MVSGVNGANGANGVKTIHRRTSSDFSGFKRQTPKPSTLDLHNETKKGKPFITGDERRSKEIVRRPSYKVDFRLKIETPNWRLVTPKIDTNLINNPEEVIEILASNANVRIRETRGNTELDTSVSFFRNNKC